MHELAVVSDEKKEEAVSIRKRTEAMLFGDRISDEVKDMLDLESGCSFFALMRLLRTLDAPVFSNRNAQTEFIESYKNKFGALSAAVDLGDLIAFCKESNLPIDVVDFYYHPDILSPENMRRELSSDGKYEIDYPITFFDSDELVLSLESDQTALIGLKKRTEDGIDAHFVCANNGDIMTRVSSGGNEEIERYVEDGYTVTDVTVFERIHLKN